MKTKKLLKLGGIISMITILSISCTNDDSQEIQKNSLELQATGKDETKDGET